jgi:hypothetical protein
MYSTFPFSCLYSKLYSLDAERDAVTDARGKVSFSQAWKSKNGFHRGSSFGSPLSS